MDNNSLGGRAYLSTQMMFDIDAYYKPNLLGGSMEYDVDVSKAVCGCNATVYMVSMPEAPASATVDSMGYCDAAGPWGKYCTEFDIMEANYKAFRAVNHTCDYDDDGKITDGWTRQGPGSPRGWAPCDAWGKCSVDVNTDFPNPEEIYGPSEDAKINT